MIPRLNAALAEQPIEETQLREEMMALWKKTFKDTDEYIFIVFDNYFSMDNVEYYIEDGRVVASLMAVPYNFSVPLSKNAGEYKNKRYLHGLYLCGLVTYPEYRGRGIMRLLIERIEKRAKAAGFDFLFLIPASDVLYRYYHRLGFIESFFRQYNEIVFDKSMVNGKTNCSYVGRKEGRASERDLKYTIKLYTKNDAKNIAEFYKLLLSIFKEYFRQNINNINYKELINIIYKNKETILYEISDRKLYNNKGLKLYIDILILMSEMRVDDYTMEIIHTLADWSAVFYEFILSEGIIVVYLNGSRPSGVCFLRVDNDSKVVEIHHSNFREKKSKNSILDFINYEFQDFKIVTYTPCRKPSRFIKPFGMLKILSNSENVNILINGEKELKYPILADPGNEQSTEVNHSDPCSVDAYLLLE